jgi:hypothetical protein
VTGFAISNLGIEILLREIGLFIFGVPGRREGGG